MNITEKYPLQVDTETFQPFIEVCGKRIYFEKIIDTSYIMGKEQTKTYILETYGEDVYEELKI